MSTVFLINTVYKGHLGEMINLWYFLLYFNNFVETFSVFTAKTTKYSIGKD